MNQAAAWSAIVARDRRFDGKFVYAARTTGLYCRPSCPARHPLSRNTELFPTAEAAEREGYLACSRCLPARHAETMAESCVKGVIHHIESHFDEPVTLRRLSERTGLPGEAGGGSLTTRRLFSELAGEWSIRQPQPSIDRRGCPPRASTLRPRASSRG